MHQPSVSGLKLLCQKTLAIEDFGPTWPLNDSMSRLAVSDLYASKMIFDIQIDGKVEKIHLITCSDHFHFHHLNQFEVVLI